MTTITAGNSRQSTDGMGLTCGGAKTFDTRASGLCSYVARADGEVKNLAKAHEHALERRLLPVFLDRLHGADDEWGGDLVELTIADRLDDVALEASSLVQIAHDLGLFETTPETKSVLQYIPFWRLEPDVFSYASGFLSCLREIHVWVLAELFVGDTAR